jgi:hypothetical protein
MSHRNFIWTSIVTVIAVVACENADAQSEEPGTKIISHGGGTGGAQSFVGFDAARRRGVVILFNARQARGENTLQGAFDLYPESETNYLIKVNGAQLRLVKNQRRCLRAFELRQPAARSLPPGGNGGRN